MNIKRSLTGAAAVLRAGIAARGNAPHGPSRRLALPRSSRRGRFRRRAGGSIAG